MSGVAFFFSFFVVLNKIEELYSGRGDQNISFVTRLVWRIRLGTYSVLDSAGSAYVETTEGLCLQVHNSTVNLEL